MGVLAPEGEARAPLSACRHQHPGGDEPGVQVDLHRLDLHPDDATPALFGRADRDDPEDASLLRCERSPTLNVLASGWLARRTSTEARTTSRSSWHESRSREARSPRMPPTPPGLGTGGFPSGAVGSRHEPRSGSHGGRGLWRRNDHEVNVESWRLCHIYLHPGSHIQSDPSISPQGLRRYWGGGPLRPTSGAIAPSPTPSLISMIAYFWKLILRH